MRDGFVNDGLALCPLQRDDAPALADLWVHAWQRAMPTIDFSTRRAWILAFLTGPDAAARATVVVKQADRPAGFVTFEQALAYLHQLVVAPAVQGQGLATTLVDAARTAMPRGFALDVNTDNARALRFYERAGFLREGAGVNPVSGLATLRLGWRPVA